MKFQIIHLIHCHFQVFLYLSSSHFTFRLRLLHHHSSIFLFSPLSSYSLSTMTGVCFGFIPVVVLSLFSDSKIGAKWLMLVLRPCPFP